MTFGQIKSAIEKSLVESYNNQSDFKKTLREFKHNILENKSFSKLYSIYDDLYKPQGLSKEDAELFLNEGIEIVRHLVTKTQLPNGVGVSENVYSDLDNLVYFKNVNLSERVLSKKRIIETLMKNKTNVSETVKIPLKSMVNIANQTVQSYLETLDESTKVEVFHLMATSKDDLEKEFQTIKESTIERLVVISEKESEKDMKTKLNETIEKIKSENFDLMNYIRLKQLKDSIHQES
jgi:Fe2+ transport system protein B